MIDSNFPRIVAVIPCYNEEKYIKEVINKTKQYVHEVIVIDDGSKDKTVEKAKLAGAKVISHNNNLGKGAAMVTAFNVLKTIKVEVAVFLDGDGQHNPDDIPKVISPVIEGEVDMVVGSRFINESYLIPFYRRIGQTVLNFATNLGSGVKLSDTQSGFRAFSKKAIKLMELTETGLAIESEIQFVAGCLKLKTTEVPIKTIYNMTIKRSPVGHGFGVLYTIFKLFLSYKINLNKTILNKGLKG